MPYFVEFLRVSPTDAEAAYERLPEPHVSFGAAQQHAPESQAAGDQQHKQDQAQSHEAPPIGEAPLWGEGEGAAIGYPASRARRGRSQWSSCGHE